MLDTIARRTVALAAAAVLIMCSTASAQTLKIGLPLSQSGPLASYGVPMKQAAQYAAQEINEGGGVNGHQIELITEDDGSNPASFLNGLNRLIHERKVLALAGPIVSGFFQAGAPISKETGVVMLSPTATAPQLTAGFPTAFRNNPSEDDNIPKLLDAITKSSPSIKTIAIIYDKKNAAPRIIGELYQKLAPSAGWSVKGVVTFLSEQMNYSDVVAKTLRDRPDVVAVAALTEDAANVARELRRQGYKGLILGGTPTVSEDYIKIAGDAGDQTFAVVPYYHGVDTPQNKRFVIGYAKTVGGAAPDPWQASTYECIGMLAQALKASGATGSSVKLEAERAAIRDKLAAMRDYPGLLGPISFDNDRVAQKPVVIVYVKDRQWRAL